MLLESWRVIMNQKKNAFTLIEMLVVVIILGVILAIAIPAVSNIISSNRMKTYQTYMKIVEEKTELFIDQHKGELKSVEATCFQVNYQELLNQELLTESDIHCSGNIIIRKSGNNKSFTPEYYLTCIDKDNYTFNKNVSTPTGCNIFSAK